jgi:hypothetical protein
MPATHRTPPSSARDATGPLVMAPGAPGADADADEGDADS